MRSDTFQRKPEVESRSACHEGKAQSKANGGAMYFWNIRPAGRYSKPENYGAAKTLLLSASGLWGFCSHDSWSDLSGVAGRIASRTGRCGFDSFPDHHHLGDEAMLCHQSIGKRRGFHRSHDLLDSSGVHSLDSRGDPLSLYYSFFPGVYRACVRGRFSPTNIISLCGNNALASTVFGVFSVFDRKVSGARCQNGSELITSVQA